MTTISEQILEKITEVKRTPSGPRSYKVNKAIQRLCLRNPQTVVEMIFSNDIDKGVRRDLLFKYSTDHWGSARLSDNLRWVKMMIRYIIPRANVLPEEWQILIKWYFSERKLAEFRGMFRWTDKAARNDR